MMGGVWKKNSPTLSSQKSKLRKLKKRKYSRIATNKFLFLSLLSRMTSSLCFCVVPLLCYPCVSLSFTCFTYNSASLNRSLLPFTNNCLFYFPLRSHFLGGIDPYLSSISPCVVQINNFCCCCCRVKSPENPVVFSYIAGRWSLICS